MKKLFKIFIMFILVLSFFSFNALTKEAATTKIAHVNIKSGTLSVRSSASNKGKKVGSLKKDAGVYVYSKTTSGWSEIRYKKKKAYVLTKYLKFANSYLMDKSKAYTYMIEGKKYKHVYAGKYQGWDEWTTGRGTYLVSEDKNGLYTGYPESESLVDIKYPIKIDQPWDIGVEGDGQAYVISVSKTVKTPAGTFKNCIEVKNDSGYTVYYAKDVGAVKAVHKGIAYSQLIRLENKK